MYMYVFTPSSPPPSLPLYLSLLPSPSLCVCLSLYKHI